MAENFLPFTREELFEGMPGKRASALLLAIEGRTALLAARAREATALYLTVEAVAEREKAFFEAISAGADLPLQPEIQDIEHYGPNWTSLVPDDPPTRAAIAHLIGGKYQFTYAAVPQLRAALGLDDEAVQQAYQRLYTRPLSTIYAPQVTFPDRLHWQWARVSNVLEATPPFWMSFALTLPGAVGLLALPIALSQIGLLTSLIVVILFGLINMVTVAVLAEAVARSGITRFGLGFLGQLAQEYLGVTGAVMVTAVLSVNGFFVLPIFFIGVAGTLQDATRLTAEFWIAVVFGICLYFLSRKSLRSTITTTLLIVFVNIAALLVIIIQAFSHFNADQLDWGKLPLIGGGSFVPSAWEAALGIMLSTFFSHLLVATYGSVSLRRDPSGRSWIRGSTAAIFAYMLIACVWLVAMNGALSSAVLAETRGTVLSPLAEKAGASVDLLGSLLVSLSLGLASVQIALGLYYTVQERLPVHLPPNIRFWAGTSPAVIGFVLAEWLWMAKIGSFANLLGIVSALVLPVLGGVFPILILVATRRQGDFVPEGMLRLLTNRITLAAVYLFFIAIMFLHGLVIWRDLATQILAILSGLLVLGTTAVILWREALKTRAVIELRNDQRPGEQNFLSITTAGHLEATDIHLLSLNGEKDVQGAVIPIPDFPALRGITAALPTRAFDEIKVWVHRITPEELSEAVPAEVEIYTGEEKHTFQLDRGSGFILLSVTAIPCRVHITLPSQKLP